MFGSRVFWTFLPIARAMQALILLVYDLPLRTSTYHDLSFPNSQQTPSSTVQRVCTVRTSPLVESPIDISRLQIDAADMATPRKISPLESPYRQHRFAASRCQ